MAQALETSVGEEDKGAREQGVLGAERTVCVIF